jgi:hypothetical protein
MCIALAACGGKPAAPPTPKVTVDANLWKAAWEIASDSQRPALEDGVVTFDEYEAAALRTVQCINEGGMQGEAPFDEHTRVYVVGARWRSSGSREGDQQKQAAVAACDAEHWNAISQAWSAQNQPTEQVLQQARSALGTCLRNAGLSVPDAPAPQDFEPYRKTEAFAACARQVQDEFGLPYFAG